jgi:acyl-CoA synthetase (AMP-forming)/AMP-acid ligase II
MTALVTCDQLIASFTSSLENASASQIAALSAALAAAGVSGGASGAAGGGLTGTYPNPGLNAAAVAAALTSGGVGTGGFVSMASGTSLPNATVVTLATWTAPRAGKIAVSFNYNAVLPASTDGTGAARITKNGSIIAAAVHPRHHFAALVAPSVSRAYVEVAAGDVINGLAFVETSSGGAATSDNLGVADAFGLAAHYFA